MSDIQLLKRSPWFDADWYRARYLKNRWRFVSPARHYLRQGELSGFKPCPDFDPSWYRLQYPDVDRAGMSPLVHFIVHGQGEGREPALLQTPEWERRLWSGEDTARCIGALQALATDEAERDAAAATFALARWYAARGQWSQAAGVLNKRPGRSSRVDPNAAADILEIHACMRIGNYAEAENLLDRFRGNYPHRKETHLLKADLLSYRESGQAESVPEAGNASERRRLEIINRCWTDAGLQPLMPSRPDAPLSLENLATAESRGQAAAPQALAALPTPWLSVIVPAHNAEATLGTALDSLLAQSVLAVASDAIEILVVDDASTDHTVDIAQGYKSQNELVHVFQTHKNQGAYAARNRGLEEARGAFITTHDADDWSHPQKLLTQLHGLLENPHWMACTSHWARCDDGMRFGHWWLEEGWIYRNVSSLMFRRQVFEAIGYWDQVRAEADTEYFYRIRSAFGANALGEVLPGIPLSLGRVSGLSLTGSAKTALSSVFAGARADYRTSSMRWHASASSSKELYVARNPEFRPFPAPESLL